jgi:copper chaperone NosL
MRWGLLALAALALAACKEEESLVPDPVAMTDEALGHYCQMYLMDHAGPKAQVHLDGYAEPLWFSQVSDAIAFVHDPEKMAPIAAIFVSDMSAAQSWGEPGEANWIAVEDASFVIDSDQPGGMGTPEAIPFGSDEGAADFAASRGGRIVAWDEVPEAYVRPEWGEGAAETGGHADH